MYIEKLNVYIEKKSGVLLDLINLEYFEIDSEFVNTLTKFNENQQLDENDNRIMKDVIETLNANRVNNTEIIDKEYGLDKIVALKIHVSNDCNLRCKYCYAHGGDYGQKRGIMDYDTAKEIAKNMRSKFPNLNKILFFGGEPLMAVPAIRAICEELDGLNINYVLQTNGTIYNDEIKKLVEKYKIGMTVSVDGPKEINDQNRINIDGKGTYDLISKNIKLLNQDRENVNFIEATYTKQASGMTKAEIENYLRKEFNLNKVIVEEVVTDDESMKVDKSLSYNVDTNRIGKFISDIFNGKYNSNNGYKQIISYLLSKTRYKYFCNAFTNLISIGIEGDIYPCQLFIGKEKYYIGNIKDSKSDLEESFDNMSELLRIMNKCSYKECSSCVASFWCRKCVAESLSKDDEARIDLNENKCNVFKKVTEEVLDELLPIFTMEKEKQDEFIDNFEKIYALEII